MREITFRGKRIDNGEWVEGNLVRNDNGKDYFIVFMGDDYLDYFWDIIVDPETVGQYTGLTDKNGKRIFEGDIVYDKYSNKAYISMEKGCWVLMYKEDWDFLETNASTCGVIGNIHDNSELLKGGKHDTNT